MGRVPPGFNVWVGMVPTVRGARFASSTVTLARCVAVKPSGSFAVMVIVAVPVATAVIVTVDPETATLATVVLDDVAV